MSKEQAIPLLCGAVCMWLLILLRRRRYGIGAIKATAVTLVLLILGVLGAKLMAVVEGGSLAGQSFYGAVFLIPAGFWLLSKPLSFNAGKILSLCTPPVCIMLAVEKVGCLISGCCKGRILFLWEDGTVFRFPSQILEMLNALILMAVFLLWEKRGKHAGTLYAWFMALYGVTRFVLNCFRDNLSGWFWGIPSGHIWSICSAAIGFLLIYWLEYKKGGSDIQTRSPEEE